VSRLPPHAFTLFGESWRLRYGDTSGDTLDSGNEWGTCVPVERTIYLNPVLRRRKNHELLWQIFAHEVLHALDETMRRKRRRGWRSLSHAVIERVSIPLGSFLEGFRPPVVPPTRRDVGT
jgi:hypothetical protein